MIVLAAPTTVAPGQRQLCRCESLLARQRRIGAHRRIDVWFRVALGETGKLRHAPGCGGIVEILTG